MATQYLPRGPRRALASSDAAAPRHCLAAARELPGRDPLHARAHPRAGAGEGPRAKSRGGQGPQGLGAPGSAVRRVVWPWPCLQPLKGGRRAPARTQARGAPAAVAPAHSRSAGHPRGAPATLGPRPSAAARAMFSRGQTHVQGHCPEEAISQLWPGPWDTRARTACRRPTHACSLGVPAALTPASAGNADAPLDQGAIATAKDTFRQT